MKTRYRFAYLVMAMVLTAGAAMPRVRTRPRTKAQHQDSTATQATQSSSVAAVSAAIAGAGTAGQLVKFAGDGTVVGNSIVTETKSGNIGVGTTAPSSKLTVQGLIESMMGGYKFPDGTIQTTAGLGPLQTGTGLTGDGSAAAPLGLSLPLNVSHAVVKDGNNGVFAIENSAAGGAGVVGKGGISDSQNNGGVGVVALGGEGTANTGGSGLFSAGGASAVGGIGVLVDGGAGNSGPGGAGVSAAGGRAFGAGHRGGSGVIGIAGPASDGAKVGFAGEFDGDVTITGNLAKGGGSFKIDHPLDPENKYLYHSFVESPDMKNIYDGTVTTDANGEATVNMPDWFEALNKDFRYQLTTIGTFAQAMVAQEIKGNSFAIKTSAPNVKVSWQVTGTRHDAYANMHRIPVEEEKPEGERGLFLHPDAFNQPASKGVQFVRNPERPRQ